MIEGIILGLQTALSAQNMLMVVGGCIIGACVGMLPGLGPKSIITIMVPVAISIGEPAAALILLAGVYYGAIFGGSTSAILINTPMEPAIVPSGFDGYPMTRKGQAAKALTIAALASFIGGTIGAVMLMVSAPTLASMALLFHSAEYFALLIVGLSAIVAFSGSGKVAGLVLATVGEGAQFNMPRFTMGVSDLQSGVGFITLAMAIFAIPETIFLVLQPSRFSRPEEEKPKKGESRVSSSEMRQIAPVIGRQSIMGFFVGLLPGAGAIVASFVAYAVERNLAPKALRDEFGKGSARGIAGPEAANNAACSGSFVPLLTLGIPGSGTTAILLGALIALNVPAGPRLMVDQPNVFWAVVVSMYIGSFVLLVLNLPLIPHISKVLAVPRAILLPSIFFFTMMGVYIGQNNATEIFLLIGLGIAATILRFGNYPLAPLLIGFILAPMMEDNFVRTVQIYDGFAFIVERPLTALLFLIAILLIAVPAVQSRRAAARREKERERG